MVVGLNRIKSIFHGAGVMERNISEKSFTLQHPIMPEAQNSIDFDSYEDFLILVNQWATELHSKSSEAFDINKNGVYHRCPEEGQ